MNYFSNFHPAVIFIYFMAVIGINIFLFDPILFGIFLVSQMIFYLYLRGSSEGIKFVFGCLSMILVCAVLNALLNHRGTSVFFYLYGLPITKESLFYGGMTGLLLAASLLIFGCYQHIMTSEKIMCLFGNIIPHISLVFSMALRLIPKVKRDYKKIRENHKIEKGILSTLIGLALEDSMETGVVMGYRGYASGKRTSIYARKMCGRDIVLLAGILLLTIVGACGYIISETSILVFPYIEYQCDVLGIISYVCMTVLFFTPMMINIREEIRWKRIVSKI